MKRKILSIIAVVLCFCMLMPNFVYAANETNDYATVAEYVEENSNAGFTEGSCKICKFLE